MFIAVPRNAERETRLKSPLESNQPTTPAIPAVSPSKSISESSRIENYDGGVLLLLLS